MVEQVLVVKEDLGLGALAGFEIPSAHHFRHLALIFHFQSSNNVALHFHFNSLGFRLDLVSTITTSNIILAIWTLGLTVASGARNNKINITNYLVSRTPNLVTITQQLVLDNLEFTVIA